MEKLLSLFDFMEYVGQFGFQESFLNSAQCNSRANFFFFFSRANFKAEYGNALKTAIRSF